MRQSTRCACISVEIEGQPRLYGPRRQRIMSEIGYLTPKGGPSFLIMSGIGRDYVQIAGGDGSYILERREYDDGRFHHYAAGQLGKATDRWVEVPTNGGHVRVRSNERLELAQVRALAVDFIEGRGRSDRYAWRDMTADFD